MSNDRDVYEVMAAYEADLRENPPKVCLNCGVKASALLDGEKVLRGIAGGTEDAPWREEAREVVAAVEKARGGGKA
jgi:hypothetical protein